MRGMQAKQPPPPVPQRHKPARRACPFPRDKTHHYGNRSARHRAGGSQGTPPVPSIGRVASALSHRTKPLITATSRQGTAKTNHRLYHPPPLPTGPTGVPDLCGTAPVITADLAVRRSGGGAQDTPPARHVHRPRGAPALSRTTRPIIIAQPRGAAQTGFGAGGRLHIRPAHCLPPTRHHRRPYPAPDAHVPAGQCLGDLRETWAGIHPPRARLVRGQKRRARRPGPVRKPIVSRRSPQCLSRRSRPIP